MRGHLHFHGTARSWLFDVAYWEVSVELLLEVVLSEFINSSDSENSAISNQVSLEVNLVASQISVSDKVLAWLVHLEGFWQLLSSQVHRERVSAVVGKVHFSDLNGIVSQEVVPNELHIFRSDEESKNFSIEVQELLLRSHLASSKGLLQKFH
jgi:hypothetical protein